MLANVCNIDSSGNLTCGTNAVLTTATGSTQSQFDTQIDNVSVVSDTANITVGTLSTKSASAINVYSGSLKTAYINNSGLLNVWRDHAPQ